MSVEIIKNLKISLITKTDKIDINSKIFNSIEECNKNFIIVEIVGIIDRLYSDNENKPTILKTKMKLDYIKIIKVTEVDNMLFFTINDGKTFGIINRQDIQIFKKFYDQIQMII